MYPGILLPTMVVSAALAASSCGPPDYGPASQSDDPCRDFEFDAKRVWNADAEAKVDVAVKKFGAEWGVHHSREIVTKLDSASSDWIMLRESICRDYLVRKTITVDEYNRKTGCLDSYLVKVRTTLMAIELGADDAMDQLKNTANALDECR